MNDTDRSPWPTCVRATAAFAVVLLVLTLAGCQTTSTAVPVSLLRCMPEPQATETWRTQRDVALFLIEVAEAGEDCRLKLEAVRKLIESRRP